MFILGVDLGDILESALQNKVIFIFPGSMHNMIPMITAYLLVRQFFYPKKIEQKITIVMPILTVVGVDLVYEHGSLPFLSMH